jgi:Protein of unknown function (DUF1588)/Protein of unknown function (DUF1592)/Protein of unknown function (DUF1595)/Protein of unknown function (DUF1585)
MAPRSAAWVLVLGVLAAGCGKTDQPGHRPTTATPTGGNGNGGSGSVSDGGAGSIEVPALCATAPHPGPSPLTILNGAELNRSVLAQVPKATPSQGLPWLSEDFNDSQVSDVFVSDLHNLAHGVALLLTDPAIGATAFNACDVASLGEATCRDQFLTQFLERAYRRPVTDEDRTEMNEVFAGGKTLGGDFGSGMRAVIEVALQSPDFVYLIEQTTGSPTEDVVALTSFETAARLAYFLTGGPPDDELFAAAKKGPLGPTELEAQARRLVGSAPNRALVSRYYKQLFRLGEQGAVPELGYDDDLATLATEETSRFIENVVFDGAGTFRALMSEPSTWVNEPLARLYGYPGVTGTAFQKVQLDPSQRAGMFTQSAFLRATSYSLHSTSPVHRALPILSKVLCYQPPPPPPDVSNLPPDPPPDASTRDKLTIFTQPPACQECHRDINPLGFAFEHYDVVGKWRNTDNGHPIDSSGELYRTDARGTFSGAPELLRHIAESDDAKGCFVHQWLGQAYRRDETPEDECAKVELSKAFIDSDGKIVDLLVALGTSDNFRYRLKSELTP